MSIRKTEKTDDPDWLRLRCEFIPELDTNQHETYLQSFAGSSHAFCALLAMDEKGEAMGFAEISVRTDHVNGCRHRPALYLEGIYVPPEKRGRGIARELCAAAEQWGLEQGCREFASDVYIDDLNSLAAHKGLGFEETERVVYFRKWLMTGK